MAAWRRSGLTVDSKGRFSKVYHAAQVDPAFTKVWRNDHALATWLRCLILADAMWPIPAPMPRRNPTVQLLIREGLIVDEGNGRYSIRGQRAERERRSNAARIAAASRWGNAPASGGSMPSRGEESRGDRIARMTDVDKPAKAGEHRGQHPDCLVCAPLRGESSAY